jgi:uncharacterized damage-inducible protein DinB
MNPESYPSYYHNYIEKVPEQVDPQELFEFSLKELFRSLAMCTDEQAEKPYAEGKWSIKDILQHLIDTERIFSFRAIAFARGDENDIQGYDHEAYVRNAQANKRALKSLLEELKQLRASTQFLFGSFTEEMFDRKGKANGQAVSVEQLMYIIVGHEMHHLSVIESKYLFA